jgi:hypothetical protein
MIGHGVHRRSVSEAVRASVDAAQSGTPVYVVDGHSADDLESFITELRLSVPLDPDLHPGGRSFDAIQDSIFGGMAASGHDSGVVLWVHPEVLEARSGPDFRMVVRVLEELCHLLAQPRPAGSAFELCVLLASDALAT